MKTNQELAREVLSGLWGNGTERRKKLTDAGYDYEAVQSIVNSLVYSGDFIPAADEPIVDESSGKKYLDVEVDLSMYDGICLTFTGGE